MPTDNCSAFLTFLTLKELTNPDNSAFGERTGFHVNYFSQNATNVIQFDIFYELKDEQTQNDDQSRQWRSNKVGRRL